MNIAFCINPLGLIGLGATITSLMRNCSDPDRLIFFFICADISKNDKAKIADLLTCEKFSGGYRFVDFDPVSIFGSFRPLHGDWTPYGILLLPDLINDKEVLYLDSDLVVEVDVLALANLNFKGMALAAVEGGTLRTEYENAFYINKVGLLPHLASFNSGVLLFNLEEWRLKKLKERCLEVGRRFSDELLSADQTILNAVFAGNFFKLPAFYNYVWSANKEKPTITGKMIIHFVGSPKPWDFLGPLLHKGFVTWKKYSNTDWERNYTGFSFRSLGRTWRLRRSYFRVLRDKIMG